MLRLLNGTIETVQWDATHTLVIAHFSGFFPKNLGYTHACAFGGTVCFRALEVVTPPNLFFACVRTRMRVCVWSECGVCGLCASKLYPIKKNYVTGHSVYLGA